MKFLSVEEIDMVLNEKEGKIINAFLENLDKYDTEDNFFCINYHNFPDVIMVREKRIN